MTLLALASLALAGPDRLAHTVAVGTDVTDIVVTPDQLYVAWIESGTGFLWIYDTSSFVHTSMKACDGARGVAAFGDSTTGYGFMVGCADGTVARIDLASDGVAMLADVKFTVGTGSVVGVESDGNTLWAVVQEGESLVVQGVNLSDATTIEGFGQTLSNSTFEDTALSSDSVIVVHGADEVSKVSRTAGTVVTPGSTLGRSLVDAYPYPDANAIYLADVGGGLVRFETDNDYVPLTIDAETVTAVGIESKDGWMVLGAGDDALLYDFDAGVISEVGVIPGAANLNELVTIEGYALGSTDDGSVLVLTDRPWITVTSVSPSAATNGTPVSVSFSSDTAGSYTVHAGGTFKEPGDQVGSGEITAGGTATAEFVVEDGQFEEGDNPIWIFVENDGVQGRAAGVLNVDNPPDKVTLGEGGLGFGNGALTVSFEGIDAADLSHYLIYIDVEPFSAADYPTGGPAFSGNDRLSAPIKVEALPGESVTRTISPLTNGTTYYVAVRAYDTGGLEGPMSDVQSEMPEETYSVTDFVGEPGGYFPGCAVTAPGRAGLLGLGVAAAALLRRRRRAVVPLVGLLALGMAPSAAQAGTDDEEGPRTMNVQLRYGPTTIAEPYIEQVFGTDTEILWFEYGYASRFVDANLGIGFFQELAFLQTADGRVSDEHDMFTMVPLALTLTGRLDILDEQPIVPFGRIGLDYWLWRENWYEADPAANASERTGGKYGWHYGGGLLVLLDVIDRRAASRLEATTGINDTYLAAEYRKTNLVHGDQQVNLSSEEVTFGLKFDF